MNFILQCAIIILVGIIIGIFCTILFFRLDKSWKQILLGFGGMLTTGGIWKVIAINLDIAQNNMTVILFLLIVSVMCSVFVTFKEMCKLLRDQTGENVIRILDIIIGYDDFLKNYYEARKVNADKIVRSEELERRQNELDKKEAYLQSLKQNIDEQIQQCIILELPENGQYAITNQFVQKIPYFVKHISKFECDLEKLTEDFLDIFTEDKDYNAECLKGYFTGIGMYIAHDLFGTSNEDVRTHFRILRNNQYVQYSVILGQKISDDKISDIPQNNSGMIGKSFELKQSLVASLNPESTYDTKTKWEDYMTFTYYNFLNDKAPFLSMGISIKYSEQFKEMLYFLNFYRIEDTLQDAMNRINKVCNIVETLKVV